MRKNLYPTIVTLVIERDGKEPFSRSIEVTAASRSDAIARAYRALTRDDQDVATVIGVREFLQV